MERINITDQRGEYAGFFIEDKAEKFDEATWWDGSNHISKATRDKFEHETLYKTASGKWVLNHWSQWQGSTAAYILISEKQALKWLAENEEWDFLEDNYPEYVKQLQV